MVLFVGSALHNCQPCCCCVLQTVAHARMEQQLYGSSSRSREEDSRVISGKSRSLGGGEAAGLLATGSSSAGPVPLLVSTCLGVCSTAVCPAERLLHAASDCKLTEEPEDSPPSASCVVLWAAITAPECRQVEVC
jgi:hypothetical protein